MKVLIVDDEEIERIGLSTILTRNFPNIEVKQSRNAQVAIDMIETFLPDLILMDIKMPGMNGLDAIKLIHSKFPQIKFIMITAYAKFDYAQTALKLGVKDYLLKPSKTSEIIKTVGEALKQIEEERVLLATSTQQYNVLKKALPIVEADVVTQLLFDHVHNKQTEELIDLFDMKMGKRNFVMSLILPKGSERFYSTIRERIRELECGYVGALYGRQLPIIVFRDGKKTFRSQVVSLARGILTIPNREDRKGWFIGIGNVYESVDQLRQSYQESLIATKDTDLHVNFRFYSDSPPMSTGVNGRNFKELEKRFFEQIRNGQWEEVSKNVMALIRRLETEGRDLLQSQQRVLELLWIASRVLNELGVEHESPLYSSEVLNYRQLQYETDLLLQRLWDSYVNHYNQLEDDTIQQIKQYIIENSHLAVSLESIAEKVSLSPIYISKLFKEQLGVNYITFLTECRIEKAKKLMMDMDKSLKEITFEVGYQDPNYFSKVFKKLCGVSPTEYRRSLMGINR
ncbi:response regulator [Bacillus spongiae]|uniref:Response regulator n=1 Tax=Bacillus spongiae TaxID=2683610 RepID=A0ABU8HHE0_9BACI